MKGKVAVGAVVGALVGIAAGVLTAPKSGRETRDEIANKAGELKEQALGKKDDLLDKTDETVVAAKEKAGGLFEKIRNIGKE